MVAELTKKNISELIEQAAKPVVIDVFAPWCGPCLQMAPTFEQLADELSNRYDFVKLNVDEERDLAIQYSVTSIPTFIFIKENTVIGRETGYMSKDALAAKIREYLGA